MTLHTNAFEQAGADSSRDIIKLVVMAVGGQGGGVLSGWIEAVARIEGRSVQMTSVAGVAQRTGATVYYVEMAPANTSAPVFSLAPAAGDVDVLIASEMMEAGRAIQRGFVTPDRTTLIASTHRALAVSEKIAPGNGIAQSDEVRAAAEIAAHKLVIADMEALAVGAGSVISSSLLGALAGSGALPFARESYETAIRNSGKGVEASLRAFADGFDAAVNGNDETRIGATKSQPAPQPQGPSHLIADWQALTGRVATFPELVQAMALPGLQKVVAFQDLDYGRAYLDRVDQALKSDHPEKDHALSVSAAKHVANAMAYDDVIGVADKKTARVRFARIRQEMNQSGDQIMRLTEFMHPRAEEIAGLLPAGLGMRVENSPKWMNRLDWMFNRGRRVRTDSVIGFVMLYLIAGLRRYRLRTRRHAVETEHLDRWFSDALTTAATNYDLGVEILNCRRLIKGYSDTHTRGLSKFGRVIDGIKLIEGRPDAADWARRLRDAALQDAAGKALDGALQTIRSFS